MSCRGNKKEKQKKQDRLPEAPPRLQRGWEHQHMERQDKQSPGALTEDTQDHTGGLILKGSQLQSKFKEAAKGAGPQAGSDHYFSYRGLPAALRQDGAAARVSLCSR